MSMKKIGGVGGLLLLLGLAATVLTGCEEEDYESYVPTFEGFVVSPAEPIGGDSVVFEAVQSQIGHLLYKAVYTWTITYTSTSGEDDIEQTVTQKVVYDVQPANPKVGIRVPEGTTGRLEVTFSGEYHYSGTGVQASSGGTYNDPSTGRYGSIRLVQSSTLYGICRGTARVTVH